jgi:hypothetical protein
VRLALGLLLLGGCDFIFRLDEVPVDGDARRDSRGAGCTTAVGTFEAASCSGAFSGPPAELTELVGKVAGDPSLRGDQLELFYTRIGSPNALAYATRDTPTSGFRLDGDVPFGNTAAYEFDPSVSADGSYVAFISDRGGSGYHAYLAHRECATWETVPLPGLETTNMNGVELSWDALAVYFSTSSHEIYEARRKATSDAFTGAKLVLSVGDFPAISSDELEIYFTMSGSNGIFRETRTSVDSAFGSASVVTTFGLDPDLSQDGTVLVLAHSGTSAQVMRRTCP